MQKYFGVQVLGLLWRVCYREETTILDPDTLVDELHKVDSALSLYEPNLKTLRMHDSSREEFARIQVVELAKQEVVRASELF